MWLLFFLFLAGLGTAEGSRESIGAPAALWGFLFLIPWFMMAFFFFLIYLEFRTPEWDGMEDPGICPKLWFWRKCPCRGNFNPFSHLKPNQWGNLEFDTLDYDPAHDAEEEEQTPAETKTITEEDSLVRPPPPSQSILGPSYGQLPLVVETNMSTSSGTPVKRYRSNRHGSVVSQEDWI